MKYLPSFILASALFFSSCGGDAGTSSTQNPPAGTTPKTENPTPAPAENDPRPPVFLEGLYATSTAAGQEIFNLFDNDAATGWRTATGAGPDEGVMLYFANAASVAQVQIDLAEGIRRTYDWYRTNVFEGEQVTAV